MSDIADAEHVSDDAIAIAVDDCGIRGSEEVDDELSLDCSTASCVESDVVCLVIPVHDFHIDLARNRIGGLPIEEYDRLLGIRNDCCRCF